MRFDQQISKAVWVKPRIKAAPKLRQVYWCDFWADARLPEIWKTRPVIVVSYKNRLNGPCLVIPVTTTVHGEGREDGGRSNDKWAYKLLIDGRNAWALCNVPCTVSPSRFSQFGGEIPTVSKIDFNEVLARLREWLPVPFSLEE